ncbi:MAG TPA: 4Fe-4S binding protein [Candidatus Acidoferrales bacterium]|nr:4Fe-4S binding protein [Candidatus Acidoferrales bacterium]
MRPYLQANIAPKRSFQWKRPAASPLTIHNLADHGRRLKPHRLRRMVQFGFLAACLWIGWCFIRYYESLTPAGRHVDPRPPGVEAFLPISALMSARLWLQTGAIQPVHPAGLLILGAILAASFFFKRSFCSWICPIGLLSENLADIGRKITGRNLVLPRWADWPLRSIKYLLLGFFVWVIFGRMDLNDLRGFLESPFNQTADIRLWLFFRHPSTTTIVVLAVLAGLSIFIRHFWCRYLCPYGALAALVGLAGPVRIRREIPSCIDCGKCARACPASLPVNRLVSVHSDECSLCLECVESCPVPAALGVNLAPARRRVWPLLVALGVVGIFLFAIAYGKISGHWQSSVTRQEMMEQIQLALPSQ